MLAQAGIPFEVVPGITAGVAAPAYAGIPVTHRDSASGVAFVTGHERPDKPETAIDWAALARFPGTLVFYMGVRTLPRIAERLIAEGRPPDQPVAVVERGTLPGQRTLLAHARRRRRSRAAGADPRARGHARRRRRAPARATSRGWKRRPLHGRTVAVTRARAQASALAARLRALGAQVVEAPAIRIEPLDTPLPPVARLRPRLRDVAQRRRSAARPPARRTRAGGDHRCGDRARHRPRAARARDRGRRRARARRRRGARRGTRADPGRARADRPRGGGSRRAARRAARARRARRRRRAVRDRRRAARRGHARGGRRGRLPAVHLRLLGALLRRRGRLARQARSSSRSARPPARSCARTAPSRISRPTPILPTASSRHSCAMAARPITFLSDYGLGDEFVGVVHGVIATHLPRGAA